MSDLIERMARAMTRASCTGPRDHLDDQEDKYWKQREHIARIALDAISSSGEWVLMPRSIRETQDTWLNYSAGLWSLRNYDAMIEDLTARPKVG